MHQFQAIYTKVAQCQDCYKCLRQCPVQAITVSKGTAAIDPAYCTYCGTCINVCPVKAKTVRDDLMPVKVLLRRYPSIVASVAPSFTAEFREFTPAQFCSALRKLGFSAISETALGARAVSTHVAAYLEERLREDPKPFITISSACPAVVRLIRRHFPHLSGSISPFLSPILAHSVHIKQIYGPDTRVVLISPCAAKKDESDNNKNLLDAALTFKDLRAWFAMEGITPDTCESNEENPFSIDRSGNGSLYPMDGGMNKSIIECGGPDRIEYLSFSGMKSVMHILSDTTPDNLEKPLFLELLACEGGCINGPFMTTPGNIITKRTSVTAFSRVAQPIGPLDPSIAIAASFGADPVGTERIGINQIRAALQRVGKFTTADELNCSGCGYINCRAFAEALIKNRAEPSMCVSYMRTLAMKKVNALIQVYPSGMVIVDNELKVVECNKRFATLCGEEMAMLYDTVRSLNGADLKKIIPFHKYFSSVLETGRLIMEKQVKYRDKVFMLTVFPIELNQMVGGILQDVTQPSVHKEQIIKQAREISKKHLLTVQTIASLLGENAAESEILLDSIIESFNTDTTST